MFKKLWKREAEILRLKKKIREMERVEEYFRNRNEYLLKTNMKVINESEKQAEVMALRNLIIKETYRCCNRCEKNMALLDAKSL